MKWFKNGLLATLGIVAGLVAALLAVNIVAFVVTFLTVGGWWLETVALAFVCLVGYALGIAIKGSIEARRRRSIGFRP